MRASAGIEIGWVGFGYDGGLLPNLRIGIASVWWCRGSLLNRIAKLHVALADAAAELRRTRTSISEATNTFGQEQ